MHSHIGYSVAFLSFTSKSTPLLANNTTYAFYNRLFLQYVWLLYGYSHTAARRTDTNVLIVLYSLLNVAPDDGLMIVRNMYSHLTKNKDYSQEFVYLVGLYIQLQYDTRYIQRKISYRPNTKYRDAFHVMYKLNPETVVGSFFEGKEART